MTTKTATKTKAKAQELVIKPPNLQVAEFGIVGVAPLVLNKFNQKAQEMIRANQEAGEKGKKNRKREVKDFQAAFQGARHRMKDGSDGIAAPAFRNAMISACRVAGFVMSRAKLSVFVLPDGFDVDDGTPLVKITKGKPEYHEAAVRNESGVIDLRARPMWREGWEAKLRIKFDGDQFSTEDVANLLMRAGAQVGVGEGRPDSKKSAGMGWGLFEIKGRA